MSTIHRFLLFFSLAGFAFLSCEEVDLTGGDVGGDVTGVWELNAGGGDTEYISVTEEEVVYYYFDSSEGCTIRNEYEVLSIDQNAFFTLRNIRTNDEIILAISKRYDSIHVRNVEETQKQVRIYYTSQKDLTSLIPECAASSIFGTWEMNSSNSEGQVIFKITEDRIISSYYEGQIGCFLSDSLEIISITGDVLTVKTNSGEQEKVTIRLTSENTLEMLSDEGGTPVTKNFVLSARDINSLDPYCKADNLEFLKAFWQLNSDTSSQYIEISEESFIDYTYSGDPNDPQSTDCYEVINYEIMSFSRGVMKIRSKSVNGPPVTVSFEFTNGFLRMDADGNIGDYTPEADQSEQVLSSICQ